MILNLKVKEHVKTLTDLTNMTGEYIEHITETDKDARKAGDQQILVAGDDDREVELPEEKKYQSKEYYEE